VSEGLTAVKPYIKVKIMINTFRNKSRLTPVPAAAVRQEGQVLFILTGRKGHLGGYLYFFQKI